MNPADIAARYLAVLSQRAATAPRDIAMLESVLLWGLGAAAIGFLLLAILRRSAGAAVSFSLITLTALIIGIATGRLDFLPPGTAVLVLSLYACAALLFLTACVRIARDNALVGAAVLISILALVALGGASALALVDGRSWVGWALVAVALFALLAIGFDLTRGDRGALLLGPGLVPAALSPAAMLAVGSDATPLQAMLPLIMLAAGTLFAGVASSFLTVSSPPKAAARGSKHAPDWGDGHAFFSEVDAAGDRVPDFDQAAAPRPAPEAERPAGTPLFAAAPVRADAVPARGSYEPAPLAPARQDAGDTASSRWGGTDTVVPPSRIADDEYVWDSMATDEVRAGADVLRAFGAAAAADLPPEALRASLARSSLDAFDDEVLGGPDPRSGAFRTGLALADGAGLVLEGTRQVDEDGILSRLAATVARQTPGNRAVQTRGGDPVAALERGEIGAQFQPIVKLAGRQTVGFEALARWTKPSGEVLDAQHFVPALIAAGRGLELAERVAGEAAAELAAWLKAQPGQGQFVAVNVAAADLDKKGLAGLISRLVAQHDLPPGALVVELGEDRIKASSATALAAAKAVRQAGASLAVDDFGVGFSNLARLGKFRFDLVKTDASLARECASDKKARALLKNVVAVAHKSKMPVIAEGIEDEETARLLEELGCDFGQGFLFGAAEPAGGAARPSPQAGGALR